MRSMLRVSTLIPARADQSLVLKYRMKEQTCSVKDLLQSHRRSIGRLLNNVLGARPHFMANKVQQVLASERGIQMQMVIDFGNGVKVHRIVLTSNQPHPIKSNQSRNQTGAYSCGNLLVLAVQQVIQLKLPTQQ